MQAKSLVESNEEINESWLPWLSAGFWSAWNFDSVFVTVWYDHLDGALPEIGLDMGLVDVIASPKTHRLAIDGRKKN
jgi:predicted branched-subunit amino acid permease